MAPLSQSLRALANEFRDQRLLKLAVRAPGRARIR
jgi:hypothetical protein